jgi:tetratricopeptide (TPR) repeat protein
MLPDQPAAHPVRQAADEPAVPDPSRRRLGLLAALLVLSAVIAYAPAIGGGFIWDDDLLLTANPQMQNVEGLKEIWLGKNSCDYTPLTLTTFWLEKRLWHETPSGYHVVNILLHALATVLLWRVLETLRIRGSWFAALLFAIHPVTVASVAWIAELKNTLSAALFVASILAFLVFHKRCRNTLHLYFLSLVLFALAGLSKGAVVAMPVVLCACILWTDRKITRRDFVRIAPFGLVALLVAFLTIHYQSFAADYGLFPSNLAARISRAGAMVWLYLREIFFPFGLSPMLAQWQPNVRSPFVYLPALLLVAVTSLFFWKRKSWGRPLLFVSGYYLCMLIPVLGFFWMTLQQEISCADWWQYFAAPGIFAGIAAGFAMALHAASKKARLCLRVAGCVVVLLLLVHTWRRTAIYHSRETYCRAVLAEEPHLWTLQTNLGVVLKQQGKFEEAIARFRQALRDNPRFMQAHNNLGNALSAAGRWQEAEAEFLSALALSPSNPVLLGNLADNYFRQGNIGKALAADAAAITHDRYNPQRYAEFGLKLATNRQPEQAIVCFKKALLLNPRDIGTQLLLARALIATGRGADAALVYRQALHTAQELGDQTLARALISAENSASGTGPR